MEQYKEKYPDWFDEEGNYIQGRLENQIEITIWFSKLPCM